MDALNNEVVIFYAKKTNELVHKKLLDRSLLSMFKNVRSQAVSEHYRTMVLGGLLFYPANYNLDTSWNDIEGKG